MQVRRWLCVYWVCVQVEGLGDKNRFFFGEKAERTERRDTVKRGIRKPRETGRQRPGGERKTHWRKLN